MNLEFYGYKRFDTQTNECGTTEKYQRRVDTDQQFNSPLCQCNDRLFINIERWTYKGKTSSKIDMVHENAQGEWCDIGIYSLTDDQLMTKIEQYEKKLLEMWEVFYREG
jgi:hypothetical protein